MQYTSVRGLGMVSDKTVQNRTLEYVSERGPRVQKRRKTNCSIVLIVANTMTVDFGGYRLENVFLIKIAACDKPPEEASEGQRSANSPLNELTELKRRESSSPPLIQRSLRLCTSNLDLRTLGYLLENVSVESETTGHER